jgi:hypothetical protein
MSNFNILFEKYTYLYSKEEKALKTSIIRMHEIEYKYHKIENALELSDTYKDEIIKKRLLPSMQSNFLFYRKIMYTGMNNWLFMGLKVFIDELVEELVMAPPDNILTSMDLQNISFFIKDIIMLYFYREVPKNPKVKDVFKQAGVLDYEIKEVVYNYKQYNHNEGKQKDMYYSNMKRFLRSILRKLLMSQSMGTLQDEIKKDPHYLKNTNIIAIGMSIEDPVAQSIVKNKNILQKANINSITDMAIALTRTLNIQHYTGHIITDYIDTSKPYLHIDKAFLDHLNIMPTIQWDEELKEEFGI